MIGDLTRYFRAEARELVDELTRCLLDLERSPGRADLIAECFRSAHTLKGAARSVRELQIAELSHMIEDALDPHRESGAPLDAELVSDLLQVLDTIRGEVAKLEEGVDAGAPATTAAEARIDTVRVEIVEMDALIEGLVETRTQLALLHRAHSALDQAWSQADTAAAELGGDALSPSAPDGVPVARARAAAEELKASLSVARRDLAAGLRRISQHLDDVHGRASTLRLVPASAALGQIELSARDAARALGKDVEVEAVGAEARVEGQILAAVRDALLHLVRNAVDHGIEPPDERRAAGKPETGRIQILIERRGRRIAFFCRDDGRGIDVSAVRGAAVDRGVLSREEAASLGPDEAMRLIFQAGVSTRAAVSAVSGRGVGLDVVRDVAKRLNGELTVASEPGRGTTIGVEVPIALSLVTTLAVVHQDTTVLIPLDAVRGALRLEASRIGHDASGPCVLHEGAAIPFVPLDQALGRGAAAPRGRWSVVVVEAGARRVALGVDRLLGTVDAMIKPLPASTGRPDLVTGAALDAQGDPVLVLDAPGLVAAAQSAPASAPAAPAPARLPILVIDDSLTTRTLEQSILESAGYEVDLAASAEEGLEKAMSRRYGLFIVDVEMGGMNGLEFTARTRADPALRGVPVMLVTSLSSDANRRRGAEAGAAAYIVKGEFDQRRFMRQVSELLG